MKTKLKILNLILLCNFMIACSSDDDSSGGNNPINQLPEATQVGANTFGALVNGEPITPKGGGINPNLVAFYQFVDGAYFFSVGIVHNENRNGNMFNSLLQVTNNKSEINESDLIILNKTNIEDGVGGAGIFQSNDDKFMIGSFETNESYTGEMKITHLDEQNRIVSGTFWFDAVNEDGEVVEVREGRFDVTYSQ